MEKLEREEKSLLFIESRYYECGHLNEGSCGSSLNFVPLCDDIAASIDSSDRLDSRSFVMFLFFCFFLSCISR